MEWALSPTNAVFLRVQTGVYDPSLVGDKAKWFSHVLAHKLFHVYDDASTLAAALQLQTTARPATAADDIHSGRWLSAFCFCYDCYYTQSVLAMARELQTTAVRSDKLGNAYAGSRRMASIGSDVYVLRCKNSRQNSLW